MHGLDISPAEYTSHDPPDSAAPSISICALYFSFIATHAEHSLSPSPSLPLPDAVTSLTRSSAIDATSMQSTREAEVQLYCENNFLQVAASTFFPFFLFSFFPCVLLYFNVSLLSHHSTCKILARGVIYFVSSTTVATSMLPIAPHTARWTLFLSLTLSTDCCGLHCSSGNHITWHETCIKLPETAI